MAYICGDLPQEEKKWALFDLDWTIIRPTTTPQRPTLKGGPLCKFPDDWTLMLGRIDRLKDFKHEGYALGIITNQKYSPRELPNVHLRMKNVWRRLKEDLADIVILYATGDNEYRKPSPGWGKKLKLLPGSFYCGDASQDPDQPNQSWGYKDSDRQLARNLGIDFYTPEEVFPQLVIPPEVFIQTAVLILVGPPGCGKTTFSRHHSDFFHLESDHYKSNWKKIREVYEKELASGNKIIIDATNPTRERREEIIAIAKKYGVPWAIILFVNEGKWNGRREKPVPRMAFNRYWSRYEEPTEGVVYHQN